MAEKLRERILLDVYGNESRNYLSCQELFYDKKNIDKIIPHYNYPHIIIRYPFKKRINYYSLPEQRINLQKDKIIATQPYIVKQELKKYIDHTKKRINKLTVMKFDGKFYLLDGHHKYVYLRHIQKRKTAIARILNLDDLIDIYY